MKERLFGVLILGVILSGSVLASDEGRGGAGAEVISINVKKLKDVYRNDEKMPAEIVLRNDTKDTIMFAKPLPGRERSYFILRLDEASLKNIGDENIKRKSKHPLLAAVSPDAEDIITLKPGEEYKVEVNIAELVGYLGLKPGVYNVRLVYTMWILAITEKPTYLKNQEGRINREWESNEIQIKIGDRESKSVPEEKSKEGPDQDSVLTEEEKP